MTITPNSLTVAGEPCQRLWVIRVYSLRLLQGLFRATNLRAALMASAICTWMSTAPTAEAREQEPIRLEYVADSGCPSGTEFERMVFARTHSARPALEGEQARLFTVTLQRREQSISGSLTVRDGDQTLVRQVNGHHCGELASVLALATALAIDPSAELLPEAAPEVTPSEPPTPEPSPPPSSTSSPSPPQRPEDTTPLPFDPPDALPSPPSEKVVQVGLGPRLDWAATPYPAVGPSLALEYGTKEPSWTLGLAASLLFTAGTEVASARADFRLFTASLNACGLIFRWQDRISAGPCLHLDVGDVYATSSNIPFQKAVHRVWSTLGLHLAIVSRLSDEWGLALNIGPNLVLTQYRFEFDDPNTRVFQQGMWSGSAQLMLSRRF